MTRIELAFTDRQSVSFPDGHMGKLVTRASWLDLGQEARILLDLGQEARILLDLGLLPRTVNATGQSSSKLGSPRGTRTPPLQLERLASSPNRR